jgi:short-subunit dehydrogenase
MAAETWLVLGASSAIARAFAQEAARQGADLLLAGRDLDDLRSTAADIRLRTGRNVEALSFDAAALDSHASFAGQCRRPGRQLSLFLAFGTMPPQDLMERDVAMARAMIETNYLGAVSVISHLVPILEEQRGGRIVVVGSVAGDRGRRKNFLYGSTKAALHTYLAGLRARLWESGVRVVTIKPGFVDTGMTWGPEAPPFAAAPEACASTIWRAARKGGAVAYVPGFWRWIMLIVRTMPESILRRLPI